MQRDEAKEMNPQISQMAADSRDRQTHAIIGAAMEVHRQFGLGFWEAVYQQALEIEFSAGSIPFEREVELPVYSDCQNFLYDWRGPHPVIPAEAGIQKSFLGSRFRGNDGRYSIWAKQAESVRCENQTALLVAKRT